MHLVLLLCSWFKSVVLKGWDRHASHDTLQQDDGAFNGQNVASRKRRLNEVEEVLCLYLHWPSDVCENLHSIFYIFMMLMAVINNYDDGR